MNRIALIMLFNARGKYAALVFGLSFAVLMGTQETAIFLGVLHRSTGPLQNVGNADIWVATRHTRWVGEGENPGAEPRSGSRRSRSCLGRAHPR